MNPNFAAYLDRKTAQYKDGDDIIIVAEYWPLAAAPDAALGYLRARFPQSKIDVRWPDGTLGWGFIPHR